MKTEKFTPVTDVYNSYDDWGDIVKYLPKEYRETINLYNARKLLYHRKPCSTEAEAQQYQREDESMLDKFRFEKDSIALIELIDNYTPLIKSIAENPFKHIDDKRFKGLQNLVNYYRNNEYGQAYFYLSSMADDIMQDLLRGFIELVFEYKYGAGFFSSYIKRYLPYKATAIYREILNYYQAEYIDGIDEEFSDEFYLKHLSCTMTYPEDEEEKLDFDKYELTKQQGKVATLLSEGYNISQVSRELGISRAGVSKHISLIRKKIKIFYKTA